MGKARNIDLVAVIAAVVLSALAAMIQPVAAIPLGFERWASIGQLAVSPVALLAVSVCCGAVYLIGTIRNGAKRRPVLFTCSVVVASISALFVALSLFGLPM